MSSKATQVASNSLIARFFSRETIKYIFTSHFWGPVSNFGIPVAAVLDLRNKPADNISGPMTGALIMYSAIFMRYSMAVTPKNYLLLGCHIINETAQLGQAARYINHNYLGGKEEGQAKPAN